MPRRWEMLAGVLCLPSSLDLSLTGIGGKDWPQPSSCSTCSTPSRHRAIDTRSCNAGANIPGDVYDDSFISMTPSHAKADHLAALPISQPVQLQGRRLFTGGDGPCRTERSPRGGETVAPDRRPLHVGRDTPSPHARARQGLHVPQLHQSRRGRLRAGCAAHPVVPARTTLTPATQLYAKVMHCCIHVRSTVGSNMNKASDLGHSSVFVCALPPTCS